MSKYDMERRTLTGVGRVYLSDGFEQPLASVTTVINSKGEPEALNSWKQRNDGKEGRPYWAHILAFKGARGTLIHYKLLDQYSDEDIGGRNEENAEIGLREMDRWDEYKEDLEFAQEAWDEISKKRGINQDSVLNVECFVFNTNIGYAGQFDLLYVDKNGDVCLSDLKTSRAVYDKHQLQASAYEKAVNIDVDKLEIIRIHPDSRSYEVNSDEEWNIPREKRFEEFTELREEMDEDLSEIENEGVDDG